MLNFIGSGSAFNTEMGNTSAFVKQSSSLLLIDCGGTVFHRLQELNLLDGVENLYIIITHTHPDHVGSLGEVIFYSYYILKQIPTIFFPNKELIESFLTSIGVSSEMYKLNGVEIFEIIDVDDMKLGKFSIEFLPVSHVDTIPAYGFIMGLNDKSFYYSGDANNISVSVVNRIMSGEIDRIYQDICGLDYQGNNHLSLKKLCSILQPEYRNKIYCMHLDKHITNKEIRDNGFNVVEVYK
ncbi:phosphoribosyl 1,2-cyclic phosphodiesterase [Clostridium saccharoperbutylacetonicum]|uniref:Metal-dependent hydrolases of the beta-lactamase superfamily III n=1 Tax=Clostridium saccharoperbutylacetonicum N1-4(HMT) TaxID=931276 RepID=M1N346_9CLOT|nr:MBL fold metallo-hydrolase [Clostridium saccharoperbutylacetonicum]AGF57862.1 metal-dependent hydrolases of the beta-lactamase superfamily III [Clostridium saccharoperbutylacetonicum N1-4(HMT)]NRT61366.1 phosphoribosyl 1,2-cyclic phosphodiesterase [Clostridium saccharoperbutylacetonicum]NSB24684.1 phosphoribosyl 1,2-cyclic phosphodiesterase [Clostridium saccharoperbutylacetonicum]NSB44058.1 phosphoribosyl 1,2-cyclic phosphodiesterase [Clostridium saccharoperbutylacetonicum]